MKKIVLFALMIFLASSLAFGDDSITFGGYGGFHFGGLYWDVTKINDYLEPVDMDTLPTVLPAFGGGGHAIIFEKILIGARGSAVSYNLSGNDMSVDVGISYGFLDIGYIVTNNRSWIFAPVAGLGGSTVRLIMDGDISRLGLSQYSEKYNPRDNSGPLDDKISMTTSGAIGHLGVVLYHQVRFAQGDGGGFGMFLPGLSAGWIFNVSRNGWEIEGENYSEGPDFSPIGVYMQLELNFGGGVTGATKEEKAKRKNGTKDHGTYAIPANTEPTEEKDNNTDSQIIEPEKEGKEKDRENDSGDSPDSGSDDKPR